MRLLLCASLVTLLLGAMIGCAERGPFTVVFTSDVKGRLRPAG